MNPNCCKYCKFFYKAVELPHKHINRQTFCWLPRKLNRKFGTQYMPGMVRVWVSWIIEPSGRIWHRYYTIVSPVQFQSKHNVSEWPSPEKPCVHNISPHSCFIGKSNITNSQQSLYVSRAWVMSYHSMSDVILLYEWCHITDKYWKESQCFQFLTFHKTYQTQIQYRVKMIQKHFHKMITFSKTQII